MVENSDPRITLEIDPYLRKAIKRRCIRQDKTQKEVLRETLKRDFSLELEQVLLEEQEDHKEVASE